MKVDVVTRLKAMPKVITGRSQMARTASGRRPKSNQAKRRDVRRNFLQRAVAKANKEGVCSFSFVRMDTVPAAPLWTRLAKGLAEMHQCEVEQREQGTRKASAGKLCARCLHFAALRVRCTKAVV